MTSPAAPTHLLCQETLRCARAVYRELIRVNSAAVDGRQGIALDLLDGLAELVAEQLPIIDQVLAAEREAAKARDLTQRTLAPFFPRIPAEHPHAANDEAQSPSPEQPSPTVA